MDATRVISTSRRVGRSSAWMVILLTLLLLMPATTATAGATGRSAAGAGADRVKVFLYWTAVGSECDVLNRVRRQVKRPNVATRALRALLAGPTKAQRDAGVTSYLFSSRTAGTLRSVDVRDGVAHVDLFDLRPLLPKAKTTCGRISLLSQLNATTTQFPTVHSARYSINGSERRFYRWLGMKVPGRSKVVATRGSLRNTKLIRHTSTRRPRLIEMRVGRHHGFDRLVFQFSRGRPSYAVGYTPVPQSGGSGAPIPFVGTSALQIDMGARTVFLVEGFPLTFSPTHIVTRFSTLRSVRYGGEFEAWAAFGAGVKARTGFRVLEMANPARLVIDVAHGAKVRRLRRGHRGADVRDWQRQLNFVQFGFFATSEAPAQGQLTSFGTFDRRTARATRVFQSAEGVDSDGVVGWRTRRAMRHALWRAYASINP